MRVTFKERKHNSDIKMRIQDKPPINNVKITPPGDCLGIFNINDKLNT